jgi:hypothetical protein
MCDPPATTGWPIAKATSPVRELEDIASDLPPAFAVLDEEASLGRFGAIALSNRDPVAWRGLSLDLDRGSNPAVPGRGIGHEMFCDGFRFGPVVRLPNGLWTPVIAHGADDTP